VQSPWAVRIGDDGLATLTLANPPLNLWDRGVQIGLATALGELESRTPRAVLVRAEGRVVSAGVDIGLFRKIADPAEGQRLFAEMIELATRVNRLPCPTVFVAHGLCLTWAFELALACDFIVAARSASFGLIEATVGLTPSMGGTQRLAERVGIGRARNLVMTAARLGAEQLWQWGGIDQVVDDDVLDTEAERLAGALAAGPTRAHAATKAVLRGWARGGVEEADRIAPAAAGALFDTKDLRGALDTFADKGPGHAVFAGR
jgi:enoyl-CoA hydratase/carnithine racemase